MDFEILHTVADIGAETLVSTWPMCNNHFTQAVKADGLDVQVLDISEVICASIEG